ncbi:DUF4105 domain-containing protein [Flavobacterium sp. H122]|uniref:lipoprotein N-acyltransferase Lnb domain-containing protein n=1 Tax=Flavobacterium sp. H122 TaxID=2529860 RepID=UPI0010AB2F1F|nr:DUF4105 domain-containing protein [Flavobacterium sp. H122]
MIKKLISILVLLQSFYSFSQIPNLSEKAVLSILTVGTAEESHTLYGHTALRVKDSISGFDVVYNYGMFDFTTPNFLLKFTKGDLQYYAAVYPYSQFEYSYQDENRSIYEQKLHLTQTEKQQLFEKLNHSVFSEEKFYTYKFIDRNCTTKVIDIVNEVLKDKPIQNTLHKNESYREVLYGYQKNLFYLNFGINIIFGHRPDKQAKALFLPLDLMKVLETCKHNGKPLAGNPEALFTAQRPEKSFSFLNSVFPLSILLLLIIVLNKKWLTNIYLSVLSLTGLFLFTVSLYSEHREVLWNYNILLFNPLYLVFVYHSIKNNTASLKKWSLVCLLFLAVYALYMFTKIHLAIVSPILIATGIILLRKFLQKKIQPHNL